MRLRYQDSDEEKKQIECISCNELYDEEDLNSNQICHLCEEEAKEE